MELKDFLKTIPEDRQKALEASIDKRFGNGYFGMIADSYVSKSEDPRYEVAITFCHFSSVSGWATIGGLRWDEKNGKYVISFRGKGLGRTGRYN